VTSVLARKDEPLRKGAVQGEAKKSQEEGFSLLKFSTKRFLKDRFTVPRTSRQELRSPCFPFVLAGMLTTPHYLRVCIF
jgi:hypothetical protein